jgi:PAS domain S-box-containing protein
MNQENNVLVANSEQVYRSIVDNSIAAIFVGATNGGQIYFANPAACKIFGYTEDEFLDLNRSALLVFDEALQKGLEERKATGKFSGILTAIRKNGEKFPCEISSVLFHDYDGIEKAAATLIDISQKKVAEDELRKSNERYKLATRASFDAIWDADLINQTINWGEGFGTLFGYEVGDYYTVANTWEDHIYPEDKERVITELNNILNNKPDQNYWFDEYRFIKADGSVADVIDRGLIMRDENGKAFRIVGAMQDISELKLKEKELIKINNRFYTASQATSDIIWDWDFETNYVEWAANFTLILGHKLPPDSKLPIDFCYSNFHPDDRQRISDSLEKAIQNPSQHKWVNEFRYRRADNTYAHVTDRAYILRNADNKAFRIIGAMQDITELKLKEQELINQEIQKQNAISKAILDTQEKERAEIGKELHDNVNQLLTTTKLYLDLASTDPLNKVDFIKKSSENILIIINEIRKLSNTLMLPSLGDLGLLDSIADLTESINITQKLKVDFNFNPEVEKLLSENTKLIVYRIIQEALNNCLKYSEAKSVIIYLSVHQNKVTLTVSDNGKGFDPLTIKKGAGLKNIRNRVYLFNGAFDIITSPGKGCDLIITIPLS